MHEEALIRDLVQKIDAVARAHGAEHVTRVRLWVGALSHLGGTDLGARWALATEGTRAAGSRLELTVSDDPRDPRAGGVVLESLDTTDGTEAAR